MRPSLAKGTEDRSRPALVFADVADNPGGGGRGNTMPSCRPSTMPACCDALVGVIYDAALAAKPMRWAAHSFTAQFNAGVDEFSKPFAAAAGVAALHPGPMRCRRGIFAGGTVDLGQAAALDLGGIAVVVIGQRVQCADPAFFEAFGLDIGRARVVVVSRAAISAAASTSSSATNRSSRSTPPASPAHAAATSPGRTFPAPPSRWSATWSGARSRMKLSDLPTPCLVLDRPVLARNIDRMAQAVGQLGGPCART